MFKLYDLLLAMGIGWAVYGALNILTRQNRRDRDTVFALAVLFCFTLPMIDHLIKPVPGQNTFIFSILLITRNIYYLTGPMLWLYTRTLLKKDPVRWPRLLLHTLPFLTWVILTLLFRNTFTQFDSRIPTRLNLPGLHPPGPIVPQSGQGFTPAMIRDIGSFILPVAYGIFTLIQIKYHAGKVQNFYSSRNTRNTLSWLKLLILFMFVLYTAVIFTAYLMNPAFIRSIPALLFIFFFSWFSKEQQIPVDTKSGFETDKYKKSALKESIVETIYDNMMELMKDSKPYLDPELTLDDLARLTGETKHHISQVINIKTEGNFFNFINRLRVSEFREAFRTDKFPRYTLIAVAFECGFSSSSAFYSMFRKMTNMTPKQYVDTLKKE